MLPLEIIHVDPLREFFGGAGSRHRKSPSSEAPSPHGQRRAEAARGKVEYAARAIHAAKGVTALVVRAGAAPRKYSQGPQSSRGVRAEPTSEAVRTHCAPGPRRPALRRA